METSHLLMSQWLGLGGGVPFLRTDSCYVAQAVLKLAVFLSWLPENWDYKHMLSGPQSQASPPPSIK